MSTDRKFTRFSRTTTPPRIDEIPIGGICLSAFVILSQSGEARHVLMGHLNKDADWEHIGGLDRTRAATHSIGWMLPSSHLILYESPHEAARRILKEQLCLTDQLLEGPSVFSEVYGANSHWDLEFIFQGQRDSIDPCDVWKDLSFVDLNKLKREEIARSHEDILAHVGMEVLTDK